MGAYEQLLVSSRPSAGAQPFATALIYGPAPLGPSQSMEIKWHTCCSVLLENLQCFLCYCAVFYCRFTVCRISLVYTTVV